MKKYLAIAIMVLLSVAAYAQKHSVKGRVVDQSGKPVVGLVVLEQGTRNGVTTDADGRYIIEVSKPEAVLEFSALGYSTIAQDVKGRSVVNVTALVESLLLDEVVAIGYGSVKKRDLYHGRLHCLN